MSMHHLAGREVLGLLTLLAQVVLSLPAPQNGPGTTFTQSSLSPSTISAPFGETTGVTDPFQTSAPSGAITTLPSSPTSDTTTATSVSIFPPYISAFNSGTDQDGTSAPGLVHAAIILPVVAVVLILATFLIFYLVKRLAPATSVANKVSSISRSGPRESQPTETTEAEGTLARFFNCAVSRDVALQELADPDLPSYEEAVWSRGMRRRGAISLVPPSPLDPLLPSPSSSSRDAPFADGAVQRARQQERAFSAAERTAMVKAGVYKGHDDGYMEVREHGEDGKETFAQHQQWEDEKVAETFGQGTLRIPDSERRGRTNRVLDLAEMEEGEGEE